MDRDISKEPLSIITLSQKTVNDMTSWSPDVEEEREQLLEKVIVTSFGDDDDDDDDDTVGW